MLIKKISSHVKNSWNFYMKNFKSILTMEL